MKYSSAILAAVLLATPGTMRSQGGTVAGTIVSEGSQRALAGAQIAVQGEPGRGAVSDASGRFRITGLSAASVTLNARLLGFRPVTETVRVGTTDLRFVLSERPTELSEMVVTGTAGGEQKRSIGPGVGQRTPCRTGVDRGNPPTEMDELLYQSSLQVCLRARLEADREG